MTPPCPTMCSKSWLVSPQRAQVHILPQLSAVDDADTVLEVVDDVTLTSEQQLRDRREWSAEAHHSLDRDGNPVKSHRAVPATGLNIIGSYDTLPAMSKRKVHK
jgi:hypothetical protein